MRVALITGGTRGIGLGIARSLYADGWSLALCGVRQPDEVADVIGTFEGRADYFRADVGSVEDRQRLAAAIADRYGAVDALVNNAGRAPRVRADLLEASEDSFEELMRINLQGPYFLTQAIARQMVARKDADPSAGGTIVFVTSVSAQMASIMRGEYLRQQGRPGDGGDAVRGPPRAGRHPGLRSASRHHRHRHDRGGQGRLRRAHRRWPRPGAALGPARRHRPNGGGAAARRRPVRDRHGHSRRRRAWRSGGCDTVDLPPEGGSYASAPGTEHRAPFI